ncbi:MAG: exodeoxyribonuclease III [Salegentibacter sp.]
MKIATYNVNGINARLPVLLRWLETSSPDIACLQELKAPDEKIPKEAIEEAGYQAIWHGQKRWNGVAVLARKEKVQEVRRGLPGDDKDEQSRYLETEIRGIHLGCIYLPNGNPAPGPKYDYKLQWFERLKKHASELLNSEKPAILLGDFNVMPTEKDVYKPESWKDDALFRPEVRSAFKELLDQGWTDSIRHFYPDKEIYTFWEYFRDSFKRNAGLRIDHILLSPQLVSRLSDAGVDREVRGWEKTSDHAPVWIKFSDQEKIPPERSSRTTHIYEAGGEDLHK